MHKIFKSPLNDWLEIAIQKTKTFRVESLRIITKSRFEKSLQMKNSCIILWHVLFVHFFSYKINKKHKR